VAELIHG